MSEKKPRKKLSILEWIVVAIMLLVFVVIGGIAIFERIADNRTIAEAKGAKLIYFAMKQMAADGKSKGDQSLGWPADAKVASKADLKERLVKGGYCSERDLRNWRFANFEVGNVSGGDSANTVVLHSISDGGDEVFFYMGGFGDTAKRSDSGSPPPRTPAYLPPGQ